MSNMPTWAPNGDVIGGPEWNLRVWDDWMPHFVAIVQHHVSGWARVSVQNSAGYEVLNYRVDMFPEAPEPYLKGIITVAIHHLRTA